MLSKLCNRRSFLLGITHALTLEVKQAGSEVQHGGTGRFEPPLLPLEAP